MGILGYEGLSTRWNVRIGKARMFLVEKAEPLSFRCQICRVPGQVSDVTRTFMKTLKGIYESEQGCSP